jgi:signal transduction histidine kinase
MLGYPATSWLDDPEFFLRVVHPDDVERLQDARSGPEQDSSRVFRVVSREGRVSTVQSERVVERDGGGTPVRLHGFWVDISERMRLESELREAQKLEAIGKVAGGIAHDFNNLLLAQRGHAELALARLAQGNERGARDALERALMVADSAADLTRQLLAFARQQSLDLQVLDLNDVVSGMVHLLHGLLDDAIALTIKPAPAPVRVRADRVELERVITNLVMNARDAMPAGGDVRIAVSADAVITVSDTGAGMDDATLGRIFEPFFTTKGSAGTGLGLATAHGIVAQTGGKLTVRSAPGRGTAFSIALPALA